MFPRSKAMPSIAVWTGRFAAAAVTVASMPRLRAGMWMTMKIAASNPMGSAPSIALRGAVAPDDPPMTTISLLLIWHSGRTMACTHNPAGGERFLPPKVGLRKEHRMSELANEVANLGKAERDIVEGES